MLLFYCFNNIEEAEVTETLAFIIFLQNLGNPVVAGIGPLEVPGPDFPAGMADWAPGIEQPGTAGAAFKDAVVVYQEGLFAAVAASSQPNLEELRVFLHCFQDGAHGSLSIAVRADAVSAAESKEELWVGEDFFPFHPKKRQMLPKDLTQVPGIHQNVVDGVLNGGTGHLGPVVVNLPSLQQIIL